MNRLQQISAVIGTIAIVWALCALWWWAINGMSVDIGTAHGFTVFALGAISAITGIAGVE